MDIRYGKGDITLCSEGRILHDTNLQGVLCEDFGKDLADLWPEVGQEYKAMFEDDFPDLGDVSYAEINSRLKVANCIIYEFYCNKKAYPSLEAMKKCLEKVSSDLIESQSVPEYRRIHLGEFGSRFGDIELADVEDVVARVACKYPEITYIIWRDEK